MKLNKNDYAMVKCKLCNEIKKRFRGSKYPNGKDYRFVDEDGAEFTGRVCPECHRKRCKLNARLKAERREALKEQGHVS